MLARGRLHLGEGHSCLDHHHHVGRLVLDDAAQPARADHRVDPLGRGAQLELRAAADEADAPPFPRELLHDPRGLRDAGRLVRGRRLERRDHPRPASPLSSSGCGVYLPGRSPHRRGVGKIFPGFMRPSGSNEQRKSAMVARSSSENSSPM